MKNGGAAAFHFRSCTLHVGEVGLGFGDLCLKRGRGRMPVECFRRRDVFEFGASF